MLNKFLNLSTGPVHCSCLPRPVPSKPSQQKTSGPRIRGCVGQCHPTSPSTSPRSPRCSLSLTEAQALPLLDSSMVSALVSGRTFVLKNLSLFSLLPACSSFLLINSLHLCVLPSFLNRHKSICTKKQVLHIVYFYCWHMQRLPVESLIVQKS